MNRIMWERIESFDPELCRRIRRHPAAASMTMTGPRIKRMVWHVSRLTQKQIGF